MLTLCHLTQISPRGRHEGFVRRKPLLVIRRCFQRAFVAHVCIRSDGRLIIRRIALGVISGGAVALEVDHRYYGDVNGQLLIIDPKTVTLSIRVREQPRLQANGAQRVLGMWPNLGQVKNIVPELLGLLWRHCLLPASSDGIIKIDRPSTYDIYCPRGIVAGLNSVEKNLSAVVWILPCQAAGCDVVQCLCNVRI